MEQPPSKKYVEPVHETGHEQTARQLLEVEVEAGLSDERDVIDEIKRLEESAEETLADIKQRIEKIQSSE